MIPAAGKEQHNVETEAHLHMYVHMYVRTTMYFTAVVLDKVRTYAAFLIACHIYVKHTQDVLPELQQCSWEQGQAPTSLAPKPNFLS